MERSSISLSYYPCLSELLTLPVFRGSRLLGCQTGLERVVTGVNLSDTPEYYKWLCAGELMVTTCYSIHDDPAALAQFIPTLAAGGMSGLCVKPGQYLGQVPQTMVNQAEMLGLPLVALPEDVRFSDITKAVSDELLRRQTALLRSTITVNEMLTRTIVEGAGLEEIARMVTDLTGCSVLILDCINDRRALSLTEADAVRFAGLAWDAQSSAIIAGARMYVLEVGGHSFGFLYIYDMEHPIEEQNADILSRVLQTIPLEIARERTVRESGDQLFDDFILHLLSDRITNEARELTRAKSYGMDLAENHLIVRARLTESQGAGNPYAGVFQRTLLANEVHSTLTNLGLSVRRVRSGEEHLLILSSPLDDHGFSALASRFPPLVEQMNRGYDALNITAGCGRPHTGVAGLIQSDQEARVALRASAAKGGGLTCLDDLGLLRLIYASDPDQEVHDYIQETLGRLLSAGPPRSTELMNTLESYFRNFGNLRRMSEELYTHYNTVVYRLKSIQEITGLDLHVPSDRFRLELTLYLYENGWYHQTT